MPHDPLAALASTSGAQAVNLTWWAPGGSCKSWPIIYKAYEHSHPNIHFVNYLCGTGQQDFITVLLAHVAAGNPPDATLLWDTPVSLGARGALEPIDHLMAASGHTKFSDFPASALASCQFGGKTWGLPLTAGSYGIYYNVSSFEKKGIPTARDSFPKTWDDLRHLSKEFVVWKGGKLISAGYIPMHKSEDIVATLYIWSGLNGSQLYDAANRKYTFNTAENIAMMEYMVSWLNEQYHGDMAALELSANWGGYPDAQNRPSGFQDGRLAAVVGGSWYLGDMYRDATPKFGKWNVAPFPVGPSGSKSVSGYWPNWMAIPKGSPHIQEAFNWLDFLSITGIRMWFNTTPDLPANNLVPNNLLPAITVEKQGAAFARDVMAFFHQQLNNSVPMWNSPVASFAMDQITKAVSQIMHKAAKPKDALSAAQTACQAQLAQTLKQA
jgi:ABC-type glycerol-3-phosphate transport system substrate-binding protein